MTDKKRAALINLATMIEQQMQTLADTLYQHEIDDIEVISTLSKLLCKLSLLIDKI